MEVGCVIPAQGGYSLPTSNGAVEIKKLDNGKIYETIKEKLYKQLLLLAERSEQCQSEADLGELTHGIVSLARVLLEM